jgi:hypothetical protein
MRVFMQSNLLGVEIQRRTRPFASRLSSDEEPSLQTIRWCAATCSAGRVRGGLPVVFATIHLERPPMSPPQILGTVVGARSWGSASLSKRGAWLDFTGPRPRRTVWLMRFLSALISPAAARQYRLSLWLHGRALGLVFAIAFASLGSQIEALVGSEGIVPAAHQLAWIDAQQGSDALWQKPTLAWLDASDGALLALAAFGAAAGGLLCLGIVPALALGACVASYLSLLHVGGPFTRFQWDTLLIEAGFAALPSTPLCLWHRPGRAAGSRLGRHLTSLLLVKLMFLSGWVKLASGDAAWADGTALIHHYETQPLPNPISWWMHHLPSWSHRVMCGVMFAVELLVPALALLPHVKARRAAAFSISALMLAIIATGNYGFFNLVVIVLCLPLLDDGWVEGALRRLTGWSAPATAAGAAPTPSAVAAQRIGGAIGVALAALLIILWSVIAPGTHASRSAIAVAVTIGAFRYAVMRNRSSRPLPLPGGPRPRAPVPYGPLLLGARRRFADTLAAFGILGSSLVLAARVLPAARPLAEVALEDVRGFHMFNAYGLFAVMTTRRPEIVIEGSADGVSWHAYELPYKPGALSRAPPIVVGHMPRLDWQLWFAALAGRPAPWFMRLLERVKAGDRAVLQLFSHNPFSDTPPRHLRAWLYDYRFSSPEERARGGRWWRRGSPRPFAALPDG